MNSQLTKEIIEMMIRTLPLKELYELFNWLEEEYGIKIKNQWRKATIFLYIFTIDKSTEMCYNERSVNFSHAPRPRSMLLYGNFSQMFELYFQPPKIPKFIWPSRADV